MSTRAISTETSQDLERELSFGRRLAVRAEGGEETIEVRSPEGHVEVAIILSEDGPVIRAAAQRLEVGATEDVSVDCRTFQVRAEQVDVGATGPMRLDGEFIYLNCDKQAPGANTEASDG